MRRAGHNPTDVEVLDIINRIDDESGYLDFQVVKPVSEENNLFVCRNSVTSCKTSVKNLTRRQVTRKASESSAKMRKAAFRLTRSSMSVVECTFFDGLMLLGLC